MNSLRERFAHVRTQHGYSQAALANAIGVTRGVISNIEYGKTEPTQLLLNAVCDLFNINTNWLQYGEGEMERDNERSKILHELYEACSELSEPEQLYILDMIRSMRRHRIMEDPTEKRETRALMDILQDANSRVCAKKPTRKKPEREL